MPIPRIAVVLKEKQQLSERIFELTYVREDGGTIPYQPGQFFSTHFRVDGQELARSYSGSTPLTDVRENREFRFVISVVPDGRASRFYQQAQIGDPLEISGPFGGFTLPPEDPQRYLLIATGTGVTPYRAMLPRLAERLSANPELRVELVFGARLREECIYRADFSAFAERFPGFGYHCYYSRAMPESAQPYEHSGRVQNAFAGLQADAETDLVYLCGLPAMVDGSVGYFLERGFGELQIKRERYEFSAF